MLANKHKISRLVLICPGLHQYLKGERIEGMVLFVLAMISATAMVFYASQPNDPLGGYSVRLAIAAIVLFWVALFSWLDAFQRRGRASLYLILLPGVVLFSVFTYYPIVWSAKLAFYGHNINTLIHGGAPFVGFDNFTQIATDEKSWLGIKNTLKLFLIGFLLGQLPAPTLAYLLAEVKMQRLQTVYKAICFAPSLFSWPIVGAI